MRDAWAKVVGSVLHPARPRLDVCLRERRLHLEARQARDERRAQAVARCVAEIEAARAEVFAAGDGVVTSRMTALEREWRRLSRGDRDGEMMELWARIAPRAWLDRKLWRPSAPERQVDAAVALASDVEGVERAEAAVGALREALAASGASIPARVVWTWTARDFEGTAAVLAGPLHAALTALESRDYASVALERARALEHEVQELALARFSEREHLARALAHAAYVDYVWRAASLDPRTNPVTPLCDLWRTGYVLADIDERAVTVAIPELPGAG